MSKPERWEVWFASVRFEDSPDRKQRPVVIISPGVAYYLSLKLTTHAPREWCNGEYALQKWSEAGLARPSTVRASKVLQLVDSDFSHKLGRLHPVDILALQTVLIESNHS